jgi:hypothetical protein
MSAASAATEVKPTVSAVVARAKMDFLIMFIPLMFFAAANAAPFTPPHPGKKFLRETAVPLGIPGTGRVLMLSIRDET